MNMRLMKTVLFCAVALTGCAQIEVRQPPSSDPIELKQHPKENLLLANAFGGGMLLRSFAGHFFKMPASDTDILLSSVPMNSALIATTTGVDEVVASIDP